MGCGCAERRKKIKAWMIKHREKRRIAKEAALKNAEKEEEQIKETDND